MKDYELNINNFHGPLDLLLELVKEKQMDIFDINLVELATEYILLIDKLKTDDIDLASEYLVMAATLLNIKAKALLDNPADNKIVEEAKEDLLRRLIEHQQYKELGKTLRENENKRKLLHIKNQSPTDDFQFEIDETQLDGKLDAVKLIMNLRKMFERTHARKLRETTIQKFNLSPAERRIELLEIIKNKSNVKFEDIFSVPTINHFVITVITVLDMSRKQELILEQSDQYGEILIKKGVINE